MKTSKAGKRAKPATTGVTGVSPRLPKQARPKEPPQVPAAASRASGESLTLAEMQKMSFSSVLDALALTREAYSQERVEMRLLLGLDHWQRAESETQVVANLKRFRDHLTQLEDALREYVKVVAQHRRRLDRISK
jgi:hypothetical protein